MCSAISIVETPLHILNLVALLSTEGIKDKIEFVDLIVIEQFSIDKNLLDGIASSSLFREIEIINPYHKQSRKIDVVLDSLKRCLFCRRYGHHIQEKLYGISSNQYDYLFAGCATIYAMDIKQLCCPSGKTIFFEEGEGSYLGNFVKSAACYDREILCKSKSISRRIFGSVFDILSRRRMRFNAESLYLYRPDLVDGGVYSKNVVLRKLTPLSSLKDIDFLKSTSSYGNSSHANWIYLGNPDCDLHDTEKKSCIDIVRRIEATGTEFLYKAHPRSKDQLVPIGTNMRIDSNSSMWEIRCLSGEINSKTVLFGFGSTAQMNPVRMFGVKPTLVFLHKFLDGGIDRKYAEQAYIKALDLYGGTEKIYAPRNFKELDSVLQKLMKDK